MNRILRSLLDGEIPKPPRDDWDDFNDWNADKTRQPHGDYEDWKRYERERWKRGSRAWLASYLADQSPTAALDADLAQAEKRLQIRQELRAVRRAMIQGWIALYGFCTSLAELIPLTNHGDFKDYVIALVVSFFVVGLPTATGMRWWYEALKET